MPLAAAVHTLKLRFMNTRPGIKNHIPREARRRLVRTQFPQHNLNSLIIIKERQRPVWLHRLGVRVKKQGNLGTNLLIQFPLGRIQRHIMVDLHWQLPRRLTARVLNQVPQARNLIGMFNLTPLRVLHFHFVKFSGGLQSPLLVPGRIRAIRVILILLLALQIPRILVGGIQFQAFQVILDYPTIRTIHLLNSFQNMDLLVQETKGRVLVQATEGRNNLVEEMIYKWNFMYNFFCDNHIFFLVFYVRIMKMGSFFQSDWYTKTLNILVVPGFSMCYH